MTKVESDLQRVLQQFEWYSQDIISDLVGELRKRKIITENTDTPITITMEHVSQIPPVKSELDMWLVRGDAKDMIEVIKICQLEMARLNTPFQTYNSFLV